MVCQLTNMKGCVITLKKSCEITFKCIIQSRMIGKL